MFCSGHRASPVIEGGLSHRLAKLGSRLALKAQVEAQRVEATLLSSKSDLAEIQKGRGGSVASKQHSALFGSVPSITFGKRCSGITVAIGQHIHSSGMKL